MTTKNATFLDNSIPFDELDQRRRKASAVSRKPSGAQQPEYESEAMARINEIFNPAVKIPVTKGHYVVPDEVTLDDFDACNDIDIEKLAELKEVFLLFDIDADGFISKDDLRFTFIALGSEVDDEMVAQMLQEAKDPLDFDAFVELISHRTVELDPEDVLLEAWSKWDTYGTGKIEEKRMYEEVTNYGDRLSTDEADEAFRHAPIAKAKSLEEPPMINYPEFCRLLSGVRKRKE